MSASQDNLNPPNDESQMEPESLINFKDAQTGDNKFGDVAARDIHKYYLLLLTEAGVTDQLKFIGPYLESLRERYQFLRLPIAWGSESASNGEQPVQGPAIDEIYTPLTINVPNDSTGETELLSGDELRTRIAERSAQLKRLQEVHSDEGEDLEMPWQYYFQPALTRTGIGARDIARPKEVQEWSSRLPAEADAKQTFRVKKCQPQLAVGALGKPKQRLVLLGGPGSGKSTVLRYVAVRLTQALETVKQQPDLLGWDTSRIPILISLGKLNDGFNGTKANFDVLLNALVSNLYELVVPITIEDGQRSLQKILFSGNVILLFDGLDELSEDKNKQTHTTSRNNAIQAINELTQRYPKISVIVTCREITYNSNSIKFDDKWAVHILQPFNRRQVYRFIKRWYGWYEDPEYDDDLWPQINTYEDLRQAISTNNYDDENWNSVSPLRLTLLANLHRRLSLKGEGLYPRRADLYEQLVHLLLYSWERQRSAPFTKGHDLLFQIKKLKDHVTDEEPNIEELRPLRKVLHEVAFSIYDAAKPGESRGEIHRDRLIGDLSRFLRAQNFSGTNAASGAELLLRVLSDEAGLLVEDNERSTYRFAHRALHQYLAAYHLAEHPRCEHLASDRWQSVDGQRWREVILLMMDCLCRENLAQWVGPIWLSPYQLLDPELVRPICEAQRDALLAADCYTAIERLEGIESYRPKIEAQLRTALAGAFPDPPIVDPCLNASERMRGGFYLCEFGDPRPWVQTLPPPMVTIKGGEFQIGITEDEYEQLIAQVQASTLGDVGQMENVYTRSKNRELVRVEDFELARYPVTNAQYQKFLDQGGYNFEASWWSGDRSTWLKQNGKIEPARWNDEDKHYGQARPNCPVVGINWYEATAFCNWLTETLNDGHVYRLPTEAEWEYAACGQERRKYPWGDDEPSEERAYYHNEGGGPTTVGCFPQGATPETGLLDMAGNVREWTNSVFRDYPYDPHDGREEERIIAQPLVEAVTRGGSWADDSFSLLTYYRGASFPATQYTDVGMRLVRQKRR